MADVKLDAGFEEVALDDGFEEVPVTDKGRSPAVVAPAASLANSLRDKPSDHAEMNAYLAGTAQGATFGFSDELGATKDVVGDYFTNNPTAKKWREYQQLREAENKRLSDESPLAYMGGELTGGVASSLLIPGGGAAKVASSMGKYAPAAGKFLAGQGESAAARMLGKGTAMAIEGAPIGAAYGIGASEHNINAPTELIKDGVSGAGMGSITGMALGTTIQGGKEAFKKAGELAVDSNLLRQAKEAFNMGTKGVNFGSGRKQEALSLLSSEKATSFVDRIMDTDAQIGQRVGQALDVAQNNGVKINVDDKIASTGQKIFNTLFVENPTLGEFLEPKSARLLKMLANREQGSMTPTEARALKDSLYGLSDNLAGFNSDTAHFARTLGNDLARDIDKVMKNAIPDYAVAAREFETFRRMVPETIMSKGTPSKYNKVYMGNLKNPELKLFEASRDMLEGSQLPGTSKQAPKMTFEQLKRNLTELEGTNPDLIKSMGSETAEDLVSGLRKESDQLAATATSWGKDPNAGLNHSLFSVAGLSSTGRGTIISGSNLAGRVTAGVQNSSPVKMSSALFKTTNDQLQGLSQRLKASPGTAPLGDALENALMQKNDAAKNAVLFKMMQTPEYRNLLREEGLSEEEK